MRIQRPAKIYKQELVLWELENKIQIHPITGCWFPPNTNNQPRYKLGITLENGERIHPYAYRYFYEHFKGDDHYTFKEGETASHTCEEACKKLGLQHSRCCNPDHIIPESMSENVLRTIASRKENSAIPDKRCPSNIHGRERLDWFLINYTEVTDTGCIEFTGNVSTSYAKRKFRFSQKEANKDSALHRIVAAFKYKYDTSLEHMAQLPTVRHTCNNKLCLNADHLECDFDGTGNRKNTLDSLSYSKNIKFSEDDVRKMCESLQEKGIFSNQQKSEWCNEQLKYLETKGISVHRETVMKIARRATWTHISEEYTWEW